MKTKSPLASIKDFVPVPGDIFLFENQKTKIIWIVLSDYIDMGAGYPPDHYFNAMYVWTNGPSENSQLYKEKICSKFSSLVVNSKLI